MESNYQPHLESSKVLFNNATVGILAVNSDGIITMANPYLLKQFGYESDKELLGKKVEILIPQALRTRHEKYRSNYSEHPQHRPMGIGLDLMALKKDGSEFPVEISLGYYNINGQHYAIAFINDITQRKEIEKRIISLNAELEQKVEERTQELSKIVHQLELQIKETELARAELVKANAFQKAILDYAGAIIIATDANGIIQLFNPEAERALGYTANEVIGKYTPALFHDEEEMIEKAREFSEELNMVVPEGFETFVIKSRLRLPNRHEWIYVGKKGKKFPVLLTVSVLHDDSGNINGFLGIAHDISQRKKAENELQKSLEKEKELSELKSRFVSTASHEFRTPLSTILSSVYLLSKYTTSEEQNKRAKHIDRIVSSVTMLTDILNDFLSVGKIEEGKIEVKWKEFNIEETISAVLNEMHGLLKKGQTFAYTHEGQSSVILDISLLKHIVMNLVSNAIKFSPENSPLVIKSSVDDEQIFFSVKDKGIGISKEDQAHLFERFFRGANASTIQGTGLGLHIVKKYTEMMNGNILCNSNESEGTEMLVNFRVISNKLE